MALLFYRAVSSSIASRLRSHTHSLVEQFRDRVSTLKDRPDILDLVKSLGVKYEALMLKNFFGRGENFAIGIDGSMDYDERLEMLLFYVSATGFRCPIHYNGELELDFKRVERDSKLSVSTSIPLWVEDISDVLISSLAETEFDFQKTMERVPYALMTMAELYLALNAVKSDDVKIVFTDRPLSSTQAPLSRDLRLLLRRGETVLTKIEGESGYISMLDLALTSVLGSGGIYIPTRGRYLTYAAVKELLSSPDGGLTKGELAYRLGLNDRELDKAVKQLLDLDERYENSLLERCDPTAIQLRRGVRGYWSRVFSTSSRLVDRIFYGEEHPLRLGDEDWLTILELNSINVFMIYALLDEAIRRGKIIIGIAKDTTATDFTRAVIPCLTYYNVLQLEAPLPNLKNDRAFLTILSTVNPDRVKTPWRSVAYDTCFTTLVVNREGEEIQFRAARKVVSREKLFVRAYFQSRSFKNDSSVRSPLFLYDRPYYPDYDYKLTRSLSASEWGRKMTIHPFFEASDRSMIDDTILYILSRSDNPEVLEGYGHNQLLYLADKAVKADVKSMKGLLRGVADLQLGRLTRSEKIFTIARRFRDLRSESEFARSRAAQRGIKVE